MALSMYDPSSITINIAGFVVEDVESGTFVKVSKDEPTFSSVTSTDGITYRRRSSSKSYTIELTLSSVSKTSRLLQYLLIADQTTTVAKFPLFIKDTSGSSQFFSTTCWIEREPDLIFADSVVPRTWVIKATEGVTVFGDSYGATSLIEGILDGIISEIPSLAGVIF
ncbi:MAG: hypothetical protein PUP93_06710 [Rhizonema sp. NSF051]|nr:hypothetical protein [Rhizonema sp. NSF051]